ncbi:MAG: hypothetical protein L6265_06700 [Thermoplasmatales archaeon]|nr:hypothetical protein [Thermoplasmatales archaeon]
MRGKGVILLSLLFVISAVLILPPAESSNVPRTEQAPMPTWNVGDMWNYSVAMNTGDINGEVKNVQSE